MRKVYTRAVRRAAMLGGASLALAPVAVWAQNGEAAAQPAPEEDLIVVTGTLIRGEAPVGSNLIVIGDERIEETAATSANELLASIPQVTNYFNAVPIADLGIAANQIQIARPNIREISSPNAAASATLILVDGHRIASAGTSQASIDPDLIPFAAIERVDVVTEGGSAIYGADAVAGVINFVTRRRFDGLKVDGQYGFADNYREYAANGIAGTDWGSGSAYAAYSYAKSDALYGRDRDYIRNLDYSSEPYVPLGRACVDPNLTLNTVFRGFTVASQTAAVQPDGTFGPVGSFNACDSTANRSFVPEVERHGAVVSFLQETDDSSSIELKAFYGKRESQSFGERTGTARINGDFSSIPPAIPGLPRVAVLQFSFAPLFGASVPSSTIGIEEWGVNAEFRKDVGNDWELRALLNYSRSDSEYSIVSANDARLNEATLSGAINPFDIANADAAIIADIFDNERAAEAQDGLMDIRAIVEGPLFALPGGDLRMAVGGEFMGEDFQTRSVADQRLDVMGTLPYSLYNRDVVSAFGEIVAPVLPAVTISLAGRFDDYEDFGNTFNPKIGLMVEPTDWITLRGNWGTSFTAPTPLDQLRALSNQISAFDFTPFVRPGDTPRPGSRTVALQGSVPDLQPQDAETWSLGLQVRPPVAPGLSLAVNYYDVEFTDILATPTPSNAIFTDYPDNIRTSVDGFSNEELREFGMLAPGGSQVIETLISQGALVYTLLDFRTGNFGSLKVEGMDFNANYRLPTGFGSVDFGVNGDIRLSREGKRGPGAEVIDELEVDTSLFSLRATAGADVGALRGQLTFRHSEGYDITPTNSVPVQNSVDAFNVFDLYFKYDVRAKSGPFSDLEFTLNVDNVFDTDPPEFRGNALGGGGGYANGFTLGRMFTFGISKKFN